MAKTLMYRLFGVGKVPEQWADVLNREGIVLQDEGVPGSVTYLNFHRPGKYATWQRNWYTASIALTAVRLVALRGSAPIIDVPLTDPRVRRMRFSAEADDRLLVAFDADLFHDDWSGTIEFRFRTAQAPPFVTRLREGAVTAAAAPAGDRPNEVLPPPRPAADAP